MVFAASACLIPDQESASLTDMRHLHRRPVMGRALLTLAISIAAPSMGAAQLPAVVWATDTTAPCVGITVSINADAARMQALVGPRWRVVPSKDGMAAASLFITRCPTSTIGSRRIGSATIAAVILAVESQEPMPPEARARLSCRWCSAIRGHRSPSCFVHTPSPYVPRRSRSASTPSRHRVA